MAWLLQKVKRLLPEVKSLEYQILENHNTKKNIYIMLKNDPLVRARLTVLTPCSVKAKQKASAMGCGCLQFLEMDNTSV